MSTSNQRNGHEPEADHQADQFELGLIRRLRAQHLATLNSIVILFLVLVVTIGLVGFWLQLRP